MINKAQVDFFKQRAYIVLPEFFSKSEINALRNSAEEIVEQFDVNSHRSVFSTKHADINRDDYFLSSDDKVRCFFEEDAFDQDGNLQQDKALSINKIGHALHVLHPTFHAFSTSSKIKTLLLELGLKKPEIRQSMYIFKQPKIGGEIRWHQDATYFFTSPQSVITLWFAIEDADLKNGCLQIDPNGANFPLKEQFKRFENDETKLEPLFDIDWPENETAMALEVKAGTLVAFAGNLPHFSDANRSDKSRHAFTLHVTSADAQYSPYNWLRAPALRL